MAADDAYDRPPGPDGLPILGSTLSYARNPFEFTTRNAREYGPVVFYRAAGEPFYQLNDPALIEEVLVHRNQQFVKGHLFQQTLGPVLGEGLLNAEGEAWRRQRHLISPAFHPDRIEEYAATMTGQTERVLAAWSPGQTVNVHREMMELTLEIVSRALLGVDVADRTGTVGRALDAVMARAENVAADFVPEWVPIPANRRFEAAVADLDEVVYDIVEQKRASDGAGEDVVSKLLAAEDEAGEGMTDQQVRDEVITLLLAGHETTALALTFTLFLLAQHPDVEDRIVAELEERLGGDAPTAADARDLSYLDRVLTESMRLYPPVHGIVREPVTDVELGGYVVPAGTTVSMNQWSVHRDPRFYDDPMAFRPDRWTDDLEADLPAYAYFPFGGGPRRCVGDRFARLEAKLVLATLLADAHFELVSEPKLDLAASITTRPKSTVEMRVHER